MQAPTRVTSHLPWFLSVLVYDHSVEATDTILHVGILPGDTDLLYYGTTPQSIEDQKTAAPASMQVSAFTGLDRNGFNANITGHLTNCNAHKGSKAACQDSQHSGAYAITGHRDMLPETRRLIYLQFWEECKIWKNEFGIEYPDCLNVVDKLE